MKLEQKVNAVFLLAGILVGAASKALATVHAIGISILVYFALLIALRNFVRIRKLEWYLSNSLIYFLVWLLVWILVFNQ
jgi:hypothetical protein